MNDRNKLFQAGERRMVRLVATAMLAAVAFVIMLLEFPLPFLPPYLKMDFSDLPAVLGAVLFGPWCGVVVELVKNLLEMLVRGIGSQMGFGNLQNFLIGVAFVLPYALLYRRMERTEKKAVIRLLLPAAAGVATTLVVGFFSNLVVAPLFFEVFLGNPLGPGEALAAAWLSVPFNAIKGVVLGALCVLLMQVAVPPCRRVLHRL